ncbi:MAG: hypothetical protein RLZZ188_3167, partial [Verrucomicrobiota bacterium]
FAGEPRKTLFDGIDAALSGAAALARDRAAGQHSFLDMLAEPPPPAGRRSPAAKQAPSTAHTAAPEPAADFTPAEKLAFEKELLGFYVSGHPMNAYAGLAEAIDTHAVDELLSQPDRTEFRLCGIAGNLAKKLSKKDNRPWMAFTLATRRASLALNMFADAFAAYGATLQENALVLVQGNIIVNQEGARINVKECYPLDAQVASTVRKVVWLLRPDHRELPEFLRELRATLNRETGDARVEFAFAFGDRISPLAEASTALNWKVNAASFQRLRSHPAVAGAIVETRRLELREDRRFRKRA